MQSLKKKGGGVWTDGQIQIKHTIFHANKLVLYEMTKWIKCKMQLECQSTFDPECNKSKKELACKIYF